MCKNCTELSPLGDELCAQDAGAYLALNHARQSAGFAQLIVIASLAIVAGVITLASAASLGSAGTMSQLSSDLSEGVAASSAIIRAIADIRAHEAGIDQWLSSNVKFENTGPINVGVALVSAGGALNPIGAPLPVIDIYLDHLNMPSADRSALTADLSAARKAADAAGAETLLYRYLLPFASADDIASDFSAFNPTAGVDPHFASERVLGALPDLTSANVQQLLDERKLGAEPLTIQSAYFVSAIPRFTLVAQVEHDGGSRYVERVPIEISSAGSVIYLGREP